MIVPQSLVAFTPAVNNQRNNLFVKSFSDSCISAAQSEHSIIAISSRNSQFFVLFCFRWLFGFAQLRFDCTTLTVKGRLLSRLFPDLLELRTFFCCFASPATYFRCIISFWLSYYSVNALRFETIRFHTQQHTIINQLRRSSHRSDNFVKLRIKRHDIPSSQL